MRRSEAAKNLALPPFFKMVATLVILIALRLLMASPPALGQTPAAPLGPNTESAADDLTLDPYSVYVAYEKMYTRCGPSEEYYRTDPLRLGQKLDVYAETDDGWLGIRPPSDSFCWIPSDTVELDPRQDTGTIVEGRTVAWIGTHLGRAKRYRWQVQLAKGEPVTIIGRSEREGPDGPQLWFRIVPPSGEYRWVHREQVVFSSEELVAEMQAQATLNVNDTTSSPRVATAQGATTQTNETSEVGDPTRSGRSVLTPTQPIGSGLKPELQANSEPETVVEAIQRGGLMAAVEFLGQPRLLEIGSGPSAPANPMPADDDNWVAGPRIENNNFGAANLAAAPTRSLPTQPANALPANTPANTNDWQLSRASSLGSVMQVSAQQQQLNSAPLKQTVVSAERIAQIEAEARMADFDQLSLIFSRLIAAQATAAEVEPIERAAGQMAASAADIVVAGRARLLAERVTQYRRVATRRDGESVIRSNTPPMVSTANYNAPVTNPPNGYGMSALPAAGVAPVIPPSGTRAVPTVARPSKQAATQSGYLVQVYSARRDSPPFALTDETGRTIAYASPMPGVNLRVHLNSQVTVSGTSGYMTGMNTPHIRVAEAYRTPE